MTILNTISLESNKKNQNKFQWRRSFFGWRATSRQGIRRKNWASYTGQKAFQNQWTPKQPHTYRPGQPHAGGLPDHCRIF